MSVRFSPQARRQLRETIEFIRQDRPSAARAFRAKVEERLRALEAFPSAGRRVPEDPTGTLRELVISPYRVVYRIVVGDVFVTTVFHTRRTLEPPAA